MLRAALLICCALLLAAPATAQHYEMTWSEEFEESEIDRDLWKFWSGYAYNNELQYYTDRPENAYVEDGVLHIVGQSEDYLGAEYTSARMRSRHGADFRYGRYEIRARLPEGQGFWPAIWMMPTRSVYGGWPYSGEIDIMEFRGHLPEEVSGTVHFACCEAPGSGNPVADRRYISNEYQLPESAEGDFTTDFHVFALEWTPDSLRWYVDDVHYATVTREDVLEQASYYPFDQEFYFILNLAIGGDFLPNPPPGEDIYGVFEVDYVRVFQDVNERPTATLVADPDPAHIEPGSTVAFTVEASDPDGHVEAVTLFVDDVSVATATEAPYVFDWEADVIGCYDAVAEVVDDDGGMRTTEPLDLIVGTGCELASYADAPAMLPGTLRLVEYDRGGPGVAYEDATPQENLGNDLGNTFRPYEAVDVLPLEGTDDHVVGFVEDGEWLSYQVDVEEAGTYDLTLRLDPEAARAALRLEVDGEQVARFFRFGTDEGYIEKTVSGVELEAGPQTWRLAAETGGVRLHTLTAALASGVATNEVAEGEAIIHPLHPVPAQEAVSVRFDLAAAAHVQVEAYDLAGRRVATLADAPRSAGVHRLAWDVNALSPGVYLVVVQVGGRRSTRRAIVL